MNNTTILSSLGNLTLCSDIVTGIELKNYLDKRIGGSISSDVKISGFLSVGENIVHGTSLTSGIGVGDISGNPAEVEMSAVHGAAFNSSKALGLSSFAANKGNAYAKYSAAFNDGTAYSSYSLAHGTKTSAFGYVSHVEGEYTQTGLPEQIGNGSSRQTYGAFSHAEGDHAKAIGLASHAEGQNTCALSSCSHAEGSQTSAFGSSSHAEGYKTMAAGDCSHSEGDQTYAGGQKSHAEGGEVSALGFASHAEGRDTIAGARYSHVEGVKSETRQNDIYSYVWQGGRTGQPLSNINWYQSRGEGTFNINPVGGTNGFFIGDKSFADYLSDVGVDVDEQIKRKLDKHEGGVVSNDVTIYEHNLKVLSGSFTGGENSLASGNDSFAFGEGVSALSDCCFAEGYNTTAVGLYSHTEGYQTSAIGIRSHAEGSRTKAEGERSHTEGAGTYAYGWGSHAEGEETSALWRGGHSEGKQTTAYMYAHAEGSETLAGYDLCASNAFKQGDTASHAEGYQTSAIAKYSHAEGYQTLAGKPDANSRPIIDDDPTFNGEHDFRIDQAAHAEGYQTSATGKASHAAGIKANAEDDYSFVWSSISALQKSSNGSGTFNIYPVDGISGIYVNAQPLTSYIPSFDLINSKIDKKKANCTLDNVSLISYGDACTASGNQSIAIGTSAYALSSKSIAYGHTISAENNYAFAFGEKSIAGGRYSAVIGLNAQASNKFSTAIGEQLSSQHDYSQVLGRNARSTNQKQFVWSAGGVNQETYVPKNSGGTFNVNPIGGVNGFYIGQDNFIQCVLSAVQKMSDAQKTALKNALGLS